MHACADHIKDMCPPMFPKELGVAFTRPEFVPRLYAAIPACYRALAMYGNNLVIDDVIRPLQSRIYAEQLKEFNPIFVGVICENEALERREDARGDRRRGAANQQAEIVSLLNIFDFVVDTTNQTPEQCASQILAKVASKVTYTALEKIVSIDPNTYVDRTDDIDRSVFHAYTNQGNQARK